MKRAIVLACGHAGLAGHESGGRLIKCDTCELTSVVQARAEKVINYDISPLHEKLTFDDVKANDPDVIP